MYRIRQISNLPRSAPVRKFGSENRLAILHLLQPNSQTEPPQDQHSPSRTLPTLPDKKPRTNPTHSTPSHVFQGLVSTGLASSASSASGTSGVIGKSSPPGGLSPLPCSSLIGAAWEFFGCSIKACSMGCWLDIIDDPPSILAVDFRWKSVTFVSIHAPILSISAI
jgi:hypothetical protein